MKLNFAQYDIPNDYYFQNGQKGMFQPIIVKLTFLNITDLMTSISICTQDLKI